MPDQVVIPGSLIWAIGAVWLVIAAVGTALWHRGNKATDRHAEYLEGQIDTRLLPAVEKLTAEVRENTRVQGEGGAVIRQLVTDVASIARDIRELREGRRSAR